MAHIHDRKSNFYSQKQSIRDELSAPKYLESAGDELIRILAKKQINTSTSLQEQLQTVQNFEKGFELNPYSQKGVTSLEDFKKHVLEKEKEEEEEETSASPTKPDKFGNVDELMKITGLSRRELELSLCEKPKSTVSQLYMFAIRNKTLKKSLDPVETKSLCHPMNRLKEIEKECLGQMIKSKTVSTENDETKINDKAEGKFRRKKKHRKRKKKARGDTVEGSLKTPTPGKERQKSPIQYRDEEEPLKASSSRVSLWDVKDMKKWSETKKVGCRPRGFYTIKNGKIIKLEKESGREEEST